MTVPPPPAFDSPSTSDGSAARGSILKNPSPVSTVEEELPASQHPLRGLEQGNNYVIDRPNRMYIVYDEDGHEKRFHF